MSQFAVELGRLRQGRPGALLAPMAGITDLGLRRAAQDFGATMTCSEMVDARYCAGDGAARAANAGLACPIVQVAGCTPDAIAGAARFAETSGAQAIDINMGCPAKKVVGGEAGAALMRDVDAAARLVRAVRAAVSVPVTVKMRLGWDDATRNAAELARRAVDEGAVLITVHGRTRCQFYRGQADWPAIRAVVEAVDVPVVANGDCASLADARAMLTASGAAAVMVGRAAIGQPWLVGEIARGLADEAWKHPSAEERRACALSHYAVLLTLFGRERGIRHARKHLAAYAAHAGFPAGTRQHADLVTADDPDVVAMLLDALFVEGAPFRADATSERPTLGIAA